MFVSFSVGNTGPFKDVTGLTTLTESSKKVITGVSIVANTYPIE